MSQRDSEQEGDQDADGNGCSHLVVFVVELALALHAGVLSVEVGVSICALGIDSISAPKSSLSQVERQVILALGACELISEAWVSWRAFLVQSVAHAGAMSVLWVDTIENVIGLADNSVVAIQRDLLDVKRDRLASVS